MGSLTTTAATSFRDFNTDGVPSSLDYEIQKADLRSIFAIIDNDLTTLTEGLVIGNAVIYSTLSALNADLAQAANTLGIVWNDGTAANDGIYIKVGASGSGSWTLTNLSLPSSSLSTLNSQVSTLTGNLAAESTTRAAADATLTANLATEATTRASADALETSRATAAETALGARVSPLELIVYNRQPSRPGDAPANFTNALGGAPSALSPLSATMISATQGNVAVIYGAGYVATRVAFALEPGRVYQLREVAQRLQDTANPVGASVEYGVAWLNASYGVIGTTIFATVTQTVAMGRIEQDQTISSASGTNVQTVAPAGTVYFRPFVETFVSDTVTDVEVIDVSDITNFGSYSPNLTSLTSQVTTLQSINAGTRLTTLEGEVSAPAVYRTNTVAAAAAITVPVTSNYLETNAWGSGYPTIRTLWERLGSAPSHTAYFQDAGGAYWGLAEPIIIPEMLGAKGDLSDDSAALIKAGSIGRPIYLAYGKTYNAASFSNTLGSDFFGPGQVQGSYNDNLGAVWGLVNGFYSDRFGCGHYVEFLKRAFDYLSSFSTLPIGIWGDSTAFGADVSVAPSAIIAAIFTANGYGNVTSANNAVSGTQWGDLFATTSPPTPAPVTISIASPGVVTWNSHGLVAGDMVRFATTGALPSPLVAASTTNFVSSVAAGCYYVQSIVDANNFKIASTIGGSAITTTGSQSGTQTAIGYHLPSSLATTGVCILKYGINDAAQDNANVQLENALMRAKLAWIRATYNVGALGIYVIGPSTGSDNRNNRDPRMYEKMRPIYLQACRDYQCAFFDAYAYIQNTSGLVGSMFADDISTGSGRAVHPLQATDWIIWGAVIDYAFGRYAMTPYRQDNLVNGGGAFTTITQSQIATAFAYGVSVHRAVGTVSGGTWLLDGVVVTVRNVDQPAMQTLYAFGSTAILTRTSNSSGSTWNAWTGQTQNAQNKCINSGFDVWQNGTSFSFATASFGYAADQWIVSNNLGVTASISEGVAPSGFTIPGANTLSVSATAAHVGGFVDVIQPIEGQVVSDLDSNPVVVSFDLSATTSAGNLSGTLYLAANTALDNSTWSVYAYTGSFTVPGSASRVNVAIPASATGGLKNGFRLGIRLAQGGSSGNVSIAVGAVKIERGYVATPWVPRLISEEVEACERYFQNIDLSGLTGLALGTTEILFATKFHTPMRVVPGASLVMTSFTASSYQLICGTTWVTASGLSAASIAGSITSITIAIQGFTGLTGGAMALGNAYGTFATVSARL